MISRGIISCWNLLTELMARNLVRHLYFDVYDNATLPTLFLNVLKTIVVLRQAAVSIQLDHCIALCLDFVFPSPDSCAMGGAITCPTLASSPSWSRTRRSRGWRGWRRTGEKWEEEKEVKE